MRSHISCAPSLKHMHVQFDNVLVLLSTYFFDERMYADWGKWNNEFTVTYKDSLCCFNRVWMSTLPLMDYVYILHAPYTSIVWHSYQA